MARCTPRPMVTITIRVSFEVSTGERLEIFTMAFINRQNFLPSHTSVQVFMLQIQLPRTKPLQFLACVSARVALYASDRFCVCFFFVRRHAFMYVYIKKRVFVLNIYLYIVHLLLFHKWSSNYSAKNYDCFLLLICFVLSKRLAVLLC